MTNNTTWIKGSFTFDVDRDDTQYNANGGLDQGFAGQPIELYDRNGNLVAATTTNHDGRYQFDVPAGEYRVKFPELAGYEFADKDVGNNHHVDSDVNGNGYTDFFHFSGGVAYSDVDASLQLSGGGTGWVKGKIRLDDDYDNTATNTVGGGTDAPIQGVKVELVDLNGSVVATTHTDAHGNYQFDAPSGTYKIQVSNTGGRDFADADVGPENLDSDVNANGMSEFFSLDAGKTETLDVSLQDPVAATAWVKGRLSFDDDKDDTEVNSIGGGFDTGLGGRAVQLIDVNGNVVAEKTTNSDGSYQFDVPAGTYKISFPDVNGLVFADKDVGPEGEDSDANPDGMTDFFTVAGGQTKRDVDASYQHAPGAIGWLKGTVTKDDDFDDTAVNTVGGGQDEGIGGVVVELYKADGTFVAQTTTAGNGMYQFDVPAGDYKVKFPEMAGMGLADKDVGNDLDDSDANPDGFTDVFTIAGGQTKMDVDASYQNNNAWVKGRVTKDDDNDETEVNTVGGGLDEGIGGVVVMLLDADGNLVKQTATNANGEYQFDVPAGTYQVMFPVMDGMAFADPGVGPEETDSDANADGKTDFYVLEAGDVMDNVDASYQNDSTVAVDDQESTIQGNAVSIDVLANDFDEQGDAQDIQSFDQLSANNGTITENADGTLEYTPAPGFFGVDTFTYVVVDATGATDTATVTIVVAKNDTNAVDDSDTTEFDQSVTIDVLGNDIDDQGDGQSIDTFDATSTNGGSISENTDGTLEYTPAPGFVGEDTFEYTVVDENGATDTATVTVTVKPKNTTDAVDDAETTDQDTAVTIDVLANDTDPEGETQTVKEFDATSAEGGTITENADGTLEYTPKPGFYGEDTFEYTVEDSDGNTDTATVTITVDRVTNGVKAEDDADTTEFDQPVTIDVLGNDTDPDGGVVSVESVDPLSAEGGTVTLNADGTVEYTPKDGFVGEDTFTYTVTDDQGETDTATVTVTVKPKNTTDAVDDAETTDQDTAVTIDVLANDTDPEGETQTVKEFDATSAEGGTITENADGTLEYTPKPGFYGEDTFEYTVEDSDGNTDTATVTITVDRVTNGVKAEDDADTTEFDQPVTIDVLGNDTDPDGGVVSVESVDPISAEGGTVTLNADGTVEYTPKDGFVGEDTFTYTVTDDQGETDTATVTVTVKPKNTTDAVDDAETTDQDTAVTIDVLANDTDPEGETQTVKEFDATSAEGGTITENADGTLEYTPKPGFYGEDTFEYTVEDSDGNTDTATVTITVDRVTNGVKAEDDADTTEFDQPVTIDVLGNDTDPDGGVVSVESVDPLSAEGGTVTLNADGTVEYTPKDGFVGEDTFTYTVTDDQGETDTATVTVTVKPKNTTDAVDDAETTDQDTAVTIDVLANDTDPEGETQTVKEFDATSAEGGTITENADGTLEYTPKPGFYGEDTFEYTVEDSDGNTDTATVTITVDRVTNGVKAEDDADTTEFDQPVTIDVLGNDTDPDGGVVSVESVDPLSAEGGTVTLNADGTVEYTPKDGFVGEDTFTYTVTDDQGETDTATVTVTVKPKNTTDAVDDAETTDQDTAVTIDVLANDTDPEGETQTVKEFDATSAEGGTITENADGTLEYTPKPGFYGEDTFEYTVEDSDGNTDTATVTITVDRVTNGVKAEDDADTTEFDQPVTIDVLGNDTDPDGGVVSVESVDPISAEGGTVTLNADGTVEYTPKDGFVGEDTFTYTVTDDQGETDTATVTVTVKPKNTTDAVDDAETTDQDTAVTIDVLANDTDPEGETQTVKEFDATSAEGGTITENADGTLEYTPKPGFYGEDTFEYTVEDSDGNTDTATVTITVDRVTNGVKAEDDADTTEFDQPVTIDVLGNDTDPDGGVVSVESVDPLSAEGGTVTLNADGTVEYTPKDGFVGEDTFTYTVTDDQGETDTATVTVTVKPKNTTDAVDDAETTDQDTAVTIDVLANDTDPEGETQTVKEFDATSAEGGTITENADGTLEYTPKPGFYGEDTFEYTVEDSDGNTDTATVTITVDRVTNGVKAEDDADTTEFDQPVTIDVLGNDTDPDGGVVSVESVDPISAEGGTVTLNADGTVEYTPKDGFVGEDTFTYTVTDDQGETDTATVTVTVKPKNTTDAVDDAETTDQDTAVTIDVLANDTDPEGETQTVKEFDATSAEGGTITENADGTLEYTPKPGFYGEDTFEYTVEDSDGNTDTATVTITVDRVTNGVKAEDDADTTEFDQPVTIDVLGNDTDPDGGVVSVESVDPISAEGGTVTLNADGTVEYTPKDGFVGEDTFTYTVTDDQGETDTATVTVTVKPKNNTNAVNDRDTTEFGEAVDIDVLGNDTDAQGDDQSIKEFDDTSANGGTITQNADGTLKYTPADGFSGTDTFTYTVEDARGATDTATVTIRVKDEPKNNTNAVNDRDTTEFGEAVDIDVLGNDTDAQGDDQSIKEFDDTSANGGTITQNADGTLKYTPADGFSGTDTFTYTVEDARGATDTATVTIRVKDEPKNNTNAVNDRDTTEFGEAVDIDVLGNDTDAQGDDQSIKEFDDTSANGGTITQNADGTLKYTPADGFSGTDTFTYTVEDARGATDTATVTIRVKDEPKNNTNAVNDRDTTEFGEAVDIDVLGNDTDAQGDDQSIKEFDDTSANGGTITQNADGTLKYTPADGFSGTDTFTYTVEDARGATDTATVTIRVKDEPKNNTNAVNDRDTTEFGEAVDIDVLGNDTDAQGDDQSIKEFDDTSANGGTITQNADGTLKYTPADGFSGTDTFTYTVEDARGATDTATVTIRVKDEPKNNTNAVNDRDTTEFGEAVDIDVLGNDTDAQGDDQSIKEFDDTSANGGTITQNADGTLKYTPADGFSGTDTFTYTVEDARGATDTATVTIRVKDEPKNNTNAVNDRDTTEFGEAVDIDVLGNDTDAQGDDQSIKEFDDTSANGGTITQNADGTLKYTPADGFSGTDTFTYTVEDARGATDTATVTIRVKDEPKNNTNAVNDRDTTEFGEAVDIDVLGNDTDAQGDDQSIKEFDDTSANGGTITQNADGTLKYTPADGFSGTDTFTYTVEDARGATDTATVTIRVKDEPKNNTNAVNDRDTTEFGEAVDIDVLGNDTDAQGDDQSIKEFDDTSANGGTITQNADGTLKYTPADGFSGTDTFTYTVEDARGATDTATVTIRVKDEPKNNTNAVNDRDTTEFGEAVDIDVLGNDTDAQGDDQSIKEFDDTSANGGTITQNADGTLKYTPADGFSGTDTFTYTVEDARGATDTATVTIRVKDEPKNNTNAVNDRDTTEFGEAVDIDVLGNDTDAQGDDQSIKEFDDTSANGGTITQNADGTLKYTPADGFSGTDTFTYTVEDARGATDTATVTIRVKDEPKNNTNAVNDRDTTEFGEAVDIDVLGNDTDAQGDDQSIKEFDDTSANGGTITQNADGTLKYTPADGFSGTDTFTYTVEDARGATDTATVTIRVKDDTNKPPVAVDDVGTGEIGEPIVIDVLGNDSDPDGDTLMIVSNTDGANGTVTQDADGNLVYTPNDPNFVGMDSFTYTIKDGNGGFDTATVKVTIDPKPNRDPDAKDDNTSAPDGSPIDIDVLGNDTDPDGDTLMIMSVENGSKGTTSIVNGQIRYVPNVGATGIDTFTYMIKDGNGGTDTATVTVDLGDPVVNKPPVAGDDMGSGLAGEPVVIDVLGNDKDPDGDTLMIDSFTQGANGTVTEDADGNLVYTPNDPNFFGMDTFTYTIKDGNGGFDTAEVKVTIEEEDPKVNKIFGTDGNDKRIDGTDGDDIICAGEGHDCLYVSKGDDILDGQGGYDLVLYETGSSDDYIFQSNPDGTVTAIGDYGTDLLIDIEGIYFQESQEWFKIEDLVDA